MELRSKEKGSGTQRIADLNKSTPGIKSVFLSPSFEQNTRRAYDDYMRRKLISWLVHGESDRRPFWLGLGLLKQIDVKQLFSLPFTPLLYGSLA